MKKKTYKKPQTQIVATDIDCQALMTAPSSQTIRETFLGNATKPNGGVRNIRTWETNPWSCPEKQP